jgi:hypothetical protein
MAENIFKSWFTTLLGCVLMGLGVYEWWMKGETDWYRIAAPIVGGFALLYMKDKISEWIVEFFKAILSKITGK